MIDRAHRSAVARGLAACGLTLALGLALLAGFSAPVSAMAKASQPAVSRAVIVLAPFLTWDDISADKTPAMWSLLGESAVGNMNAHTGEDGWPTVAGGVLTLSASRWAKGPDGGPLDAASLDRARGANASSLSEPTFGSLGSAVRAAGGSSVAVGASDTDTSAAVGRLRPAELLATDESGTVDAVYSDVLIPDPSAAFGLRTDPAALDAAIASALRWRRGVVVVDTGDLSRAHDATSAAATIARRHDDAIRALDRAVGTVSTLLRSQPASDTLLVVVAPATDKEWYKAPAFGPLIISGAGFQGEIVSSSTRRPGLATNLDIAPTVLASLGATVPAEMLGKPLTSRATQFTVAHSVSRLARDGAAPGIIDQLRDAWVLQWFCYGAIAAVALATLSVMMPLGWASILAEALLVVTLSVLPAGWLMFVANRQPLDVGTAATAFVVASLVVAGLAMMLRRVFSTSRLAVPLFLTSLTSLVIIADQLTGHPIESGIFSYSVAAGWRFYGMGNEGAAILVAASIAAVALAADALHARPVAASAVRRFGLPVAGAIVLFVAAAPFAGANAGVAVWGIIAYGIAWAAMNGVRLSWRVVGLTLLAVVIAVATFSAIDLVRSSGGQSHLARFARGILRGDVADTTELVRRKLANNIAYLPQTNYTGLAIAMAASLALLRFAPSRPLARALDGAPAYAGALLGIVIGSLAAWATEDSGVVMPALMLFAGAGPVLLLALRNRLGAAAADANG